MTAGTASGRVDNDGSPGRLAAPPRERVGRSVDARRFGGRPPFFPNSGRIRHDLERPMHDRGSWTPHPTPLTSDQVLLARKRLLRMHFESGVGHIGGNLSCLDALLVVFHDVPAAARPVRPLEGALRGRLNHALEHRPPARTRISSCSTRTTPCCRPSAGHGIDDILFATGSLGHGLSLAAGTALGQRLNGATDGSSASPPTANGRKARRGRR